MAESKALSGRIPKILDDSLARGHRGGVITMHRALTHFRLGALNVVASISLFLFFSYIWVISLPALCHFWSHCLALALRFLPLRGTLEIATHRFTQSYRLDVPYLRIYSVLPDLLTWSLTCGICLLLFAATYFLPKRLAPILYLSRGILLVQATALFYFALWPLHFPHAPDS
jgi:hypothetical protein